jgi:predicted component of type VI protein secretion system
VTAVFNRAGGRRYRRSSTWQLPQLFLEYDKMPKLIVSGASYDLVEQVVTIGRAPDNTIHIDDPSVSGRHAELRRADKTYQLRDLGSTNGTRVNGTGASEIILHPGDRVRFGAVDARFEGDMPMFATQPLPAATKVEAEVTTTSIRPVDFANASPFRTRSKERDPGRTALFIAAAVALLTLIAGIIAVLTMHAPTQ